MRALQKIGVNDVDKVLLPDEQRRVWHKIDIDDYVFPDVSRTTRCHQVRRVRHTRKREDEPVGGENPRPK